MSQDNHGHSHSHSHAAASTKRLGFALAVTATVMIAEVVGAWISGSLSLLADAGHMFVDSAGLIVAMTAAILMTRPPSMKRTWGFARAEVLAAGLQAGFLIGLSVFIAFEALQRFTAPLDVLAGPMLWIGILGLCANIISAVILSGGRNDSLNMKAAFLEVASDALGSVAVLVAAIILMTTGWPYADSVASLLIAALISVRAFYILRQSLRILMETTPEGLDLEVVKARILANEEVIDVHDLHCSSIGTGLNTLTAHVVVTKECVDNGRTVGVLHQIQEALGDGLPTALNHVTLQIDSEQHASHEHLAH